MRFVLFVLAVFASSFASAADYYWQASGSNAKYPSANAACLSSDPTQTRYKLVSVVIQPSGTSARCNMEDKFSNNKPTYIDVTRYGDSCPAGTVFNVSTGSCDKPVGNVGEVCEGPLVGGMPSLVSVTGECKRWDVAGKEANCKYLSGTGTSFTDIWIAFDGDGNPETPQAEKLGCAVNILSTAQCKMPVPKCESGICTQFYVSKCKVGVTFTGEVAADATPNVSVPLADGNGAEGVCPPGVDCTVPDEPVVKDSKPCNYMYNGTVVGCESSEFVGNPGEMNCGTVNGGAYTCTKRPPTSTGVDIKTEIKTEQRADGNTEQTKTDVHNKTVCIAPGSCTTSTTTNKSVTIKDGNGNTVSESSTCTGANCSTGKGEKGNCPPGQECDGDSDESFEGPELGDAPTFGESLESFKSKVEGSPIIAGVKAIRMPSGGSCSIGGAQTMIGTISGDGVCQNAHWLDSLYYVFLAMGGLAAVRILMSA